MTRSSVARSGRRRGLILFLSVTVRRETVFGRPRDTSALTRRPISVTMVTSERLPRHLHKNVIYNELNECFVNFLTITTHSGVLVIHLMPLLLHSLITSNVYLTHFNQIYLQPMS